MPPLSACSTAEEVAAVGRDMAGKTVVITGGAAGIGAETARVLAGKGAKVIIGCRNVAAGQAVADAAKAEGAKVRGREAGVGEGRRCGGWLELAHAEGGGGRLRARADPAPQTFLPLRPLPPDTHTRARSPLSHVFLSLPLHFPQGTISVRALDLADLASVTAFASAVCAEEARLDVLLNNAGVMACPELRTADGFELQMGTNHEGHWLLTERLLPKLKASPSPPARVVCVASLAHTTPGALDVTDINWRTRPYDRIKAYGASKLANVLHAKALASRHDPGAVLAFSLHPGVIQTDLFRHVGGAPGTWAGAALAAVGGAVRGVGSLILGRPLMKTVPQGAATSVFAITSPTLDASKNGFYLADCAPCAPSAAGRDGALAAALWAATEKEVGEAMAKRGIK